MEEVPFCAKPYIFNLPCVKKAGAAILFCHARLYVFRLFQTLSGLTMNCRWVHNIDHLRDMSGRNGRKEKKKPIIGCRLRLKLLGLRLWGQEEHTNYFSRIKLGKHWNNLSSVPHVIWMKFESVSCALPGEDCCVRMFLNCQEWWHFKKWCHMWEAEVVESAISEG